MAVPPSQSRTDRLLRDMGRRIRNGREALKLSQGAFGEGVAARLHELGAEWPTTIQQARVSDWENGKRWPEPICLYAIAKELGISVGKLMTGKDCG